MEPMRKRAKHYAMTNCHTWDVRALKNTEDDFVAGAQSEREELLRWRDPNVELPKDGEEVLVKADCPYCRYDVMKHDAFCWWRKTSLAGGGWYKSDVEIIGWRPIREE